MSQKSGCTEPRPRLSNASRATGSIPATESVTGVPGINVRRKGIIFFAHLSVSGFGRISLWSSRNAMRGSPTYGVKSSRAHCFDACTLGQRYHQSKSVSCTCSPRSPANDTNCCSRAAYTGETSGQPKASGSITARTVFACSDTTRSRSFAISSGCQSVHISVQPASKGK
jgi:hypothetical protein